MEAGNTYESISRSCEILFGSDLCISREFLEYLQVSGIKTAFRKRARETHPDLRADRNTGLQPHNVSEFQMVLEAYEHLLGFVRQREANQNRHPRIIASNSRKSSAIFTQNGSIPRTIVQRIKPIILAEDMGLVTGFSNTRAIYEGPLPDRQLLFGHFLYYLGLSNWRTISQVLTWQKMARPKIGALGIRFGMLDHEGIATILNHRKPSRPFGETAMDLGLLSERQLRALLLHQQQLHKKFGTILLEKNLLEDHELQELLGLFFYHNRTISTYG